MSFTEEMLNGKLHFLCSGKHTDSLNPGIIRIIIFLGRLQDMIARQL